MSLIRLTDRSALAMFIYKVKNAVQLMWTVLNETHVIGDHEF